MKMIVNFPIEVNPESYKGTLISIKIHMHPLPRLSKGFYDH